MSGEPRRLDEIQASLRELRRRARVTRNNATFQQERAWRQRMRALELAVRLQGRRRPPAP
jgi:hypothetical protein